MDDAERVRAAQQAEEAAALRRDIEVAATHQEMIKNPSAHRIDILKTLSALLAEEEELSSLEPQLQLQLSYLLENFPNLRIRAFHMHLNDPNKNTIILIEGITRMHVIRGCGNPIIDLLEGIDLCAILCEDGIFGHFVFLPRRCLLIDGFLVVGKEVVDDNGVKTIVRQIYLFQITSNYSSHGSSALGADLIRRALSVRLKDIPYEIFFMYIFPPGIQLCNKHKFPPGVKCLRTEIDTSDLSSNTIGNPQQYAINFIGIEPAPPTDWLDTDECRRIKEKLDVICRIPIAPIHNPAHDDIKVANNYVVKSEDYSRLFDDVRDKSSNDPSLVELLDMELGADDEAEATKAVEAPAQAELLDMELGADDEAEATKAVEAPATEAVKAPAQAAVEQASSSSSSSIKRPHSTSSSDMGAKQLKISMYYPKKSKHRAPGKENEEN